MSKSKSRVYFALSGDDFAPSIITKKIGINPTTSWQKGEAGKYNPKLEFSNWEISTQAGKEEIWIDKLVTEIVLLLKEKTKIINDLKKEFKLDSVLAIILYIDINEEKSTPALGHNLETIEFLHNTNTITDVDIYRYDSNIDKE